MHKQDPGQGAIYNAISHTCRGYSHQNCSRLIILNGYGEAAAHGTAFSLALNQEGIVCKGGGEEERGQMH